MKSEEDEAFDDLARRQGMWGGGYQAKRQMAADKQEPWNEDEWRRNNWRCGHGWLRGEQCEICNAAQPAQEPVARVLQIIKELRPAIKPMEGMGKGKTTAEWFDILVKEIERIQPAQEGECPNLKNCKGQCFQCEYIDAETGETCYPIAQPAQEQEEDWGALAEKQLASIKRDTRASFEDAMVRATHKVMIEEDDDIQVYKKPWVGLTDEEIDKKYWAMPRINKPQPTQFEFARAIEQMLKEKNNGL